MDKNIEIIGRSAHIKNLLKFIERASKTDTTVLLLGKSGVGKEVAARRIHTFSSRRNKPFIKVNCANLSENLLESELYGYKKGAYTGAMMDKPGLLEAANEGTFFFDEIADIAPNLQAKLLAVVEDKELRRLGENITREIDVRFILATNRDIYKLLEKGKFREDLYYRISILSFDILPLRERKEDIPLLVNFLLEKINMKLSSNFSIEQTAIDKLLKHSFPGNIRELENILEKAALFSRSCAIREEDIEFPKIKSGDKQIQKSRFSMEKVITTLAKHQGNKTRAAMELGISRRHIYRLLNFEEQNIQNHRIRQFEKK